MAGIDEAGYGPLLGPLVVSCAAFEVSADGSGDIPCLWKRLRKVVSRNKSKTGKKLHVNDSKLVYSPGVGLKELERAVLAFAGTCWPGAKDLEQFLACVASHAVPDLMGHPWYLSNGEERFPIEQEAVGVNMFAHALVEEMKKGQARCVHMAARVVPEKQFNRMLDQTRNKGSALFSISAIHLDHLLRTFGHCDLTIICDQQGGRERYGHLLRLMFEEWALEIIKEEEGFREYRLARGGNAVKIVFCEKAEKQSMAVALASMLSKYLREALMRRFNAYWRAMLPELTPTAGYYNDGLRFLHDIELKRKELGIADEDLIRCR